MPWNLLASLTLPCETIHFLANRLRRRSQLNFEASRQKALPMPSIFVAYAVTLGWALVGSISMGLGIIIALKMFDAATRDVDEWALIKQGNMAMAVILGSIIIALGLVVSSAIHP